MSADCKVICLCPSMGKSHGSFAWGESPKNVLVTWTIVPDGMQKILEHLEPSTKWYRSCLLYPHLNDLNDSKIYLRVELPLVPSWNRGFARIEATTWLETWFHSAGEARPVVSRFSPLMWPQDRKLIDRYRQISTDAFCILLCPQLVDQQENPISGCQESRGRLRIRTGRSRQSPSSWRSSRPANRPSKLIKINWCCNMSVYTHL
jgi:hypothetical protein